MTLLNLNLWMCFVTYIFCTLTVKREPAFYSAYFFFRPNSNTQINLMSWFTYFRVVVVLATIQTADFLLEWYHCLLICIRSANGFRSSLNSWRLVRVCVLYAGKGKGTWILF
jgi:hypothetical protein